MYIEWTHLITIAPYYYLTFIYIKLHTNHSLVVFRYNIILDSMSFISLNIKYTWICVLNIVTNKMFIL